MMLSAIQIKIAIAVAIVVLLVMSGLYTWGLYWRGEAREAKAALTVYAGQAEVNKDVADRCTAASQAVATAGGQVVEATAQMLAAARKSGSAGAQQVARLEKLLGEKPPPGAGCEDAWAEIQKARAAR